MTPTFAPITLPKAVKMALDRGAALVVSISGGKDSQALLSSLVEARNRHDWRGDFIAVHADLGEGAEWPQSLPHCRKLCREAGVQLEVVNRPQGGLAEQIEVRMRQQAGTGKPFWPSSAARYCTSDQKRGQIDKLLRGYELVVSAEGMRRQESRERAKKHDCDVRKQITNSLRTALNWRPLNDWTIEDVWAACGTSVTDLERRRALYRSGKAGEALDGWPAHPAYVYGNERVSCALCVLATENDVVNGARHNPAIFKHYLRMEVESGCTFKTNLALTDVARRLEREARAV